MICQAYKFCTRRNIYNLLKYRKGPFYQTKSDNYVGERKKAKLIRQGSRVKYPLKISFSIRIYIYIVQYNVRILVMPYKRNTKIKIKVKESNFKVINCFVISICSLFSSKIIIVNFITTWKKLGEKVLFALVRSQTFFKIHLVKNSWLKKKQTKYKNNMMWLSQ